MSEVSRTACFVSYSGVGLPLKLVNPLESTENRMTFFRAHYDAQAKMLMCEKVVYGDIEFTHRYQYYADGVLQQAEITDEDGEVEVLQFDTTGQRI
ncbi:DUF6156 family protein [Candidatus Albibeggiatoa sp. nov. NOAA]|uniref:DUF6156 family protein n=1 Tax=Candidatus Albibeggiatoa sp. nov. NOAA TaxID=3162724 RepID=UPI0032F5FD84|nr:DUF6156 family protein [Thiotrichaceae bacterium]